MTDSTPLHPPWKGTHARRETAYIYIIRLGVPQGLPKVNSTAYAQFYFQPAKRTRPGTRSGQKPPSTSLLGFQESGFRNRRNSVAVIFDQQCRMFGLLFAGNKDTKATYFTPCPTLFADKKDNWRERYPYPSRHGAAVICFSSLLSVFI